MKVTNPATAKVIKEIQEDRASSISAKHALARKAFKVLSGINLDERLGVIKAFCEILSANKDQFAWDLCQEVGKPIVEAEAEIEAAIGKCEFFIKNSGDLLRPKKVNEANGTEEYIEYEPLGVIACISAWNYPFLVAINVLIPGLIAGNAILYKPSEHSPSSGENIAKALWQALAQTSAPKDVLQLIQGGSRCGEALCELSLDGYFFTGSYRTGARIAQMVAPKLVPLGLELGGKDPLYVTDEVDSIAEVAAAVVSGVFYNNGQSCCSVERVYVNEKIYDEFLSLFVEKTKNLILGPSTNRDTEIGAVTRKEHIPFLKEQIKDALEKGAKLECGGEELALAGSYFTPTVFSRTNHQMRLMKEETFGPLVGVQKVSGDQEAIELMNDTDYGLTSSVYTSNRERGEKILRQINSGTGYLNCCDRVSSYLPWSGRKNSGLGTTLSAHGLYAFCAPKGLHII